MRMIPRPTIPLLIALLVSPPLFAEEPTTQPAGAEARAADDMLAAYRDTKTVQVHGSGEAVGQPFTFEYDLALDRDMDLFSIKLDIGAPGNPGGAAGQSVHITRDAEKVRMRLTGQGVHTDRYLEVDAPEALDLASIGAVAPFLVQPSPAMLVDLAGLERIARRAGDASQNLVSVLYTEEALHVAYAAGRTKASKRRYQRFEYAQVPTLVDLAEILHHE